MEIILQISIITHFDYITKRAKKQGKKQKNPALKVNAFR